MAMELDPDLLSAFQTEYSTGAQMPSAPDNNSAPYGPEGVPELKGGFKDGFFGKHGAAIMIATGSVTGVDDFLTAQSQSNALMTQAGFNRYQSALNLRRGVVAQGQVESQEGQQLLSSGARANGIIGAQKASYAAQGVNTNAGTPLEQAVAEGKVSATDAFTIHNNAALEAYGIQNKTIQISGQQQMEALGEESAANQSLLLGGAKFGNDMMVQADMADSMRARGW